MPGTILTRPPESFKPDLKKGVAWCPYCGRSQAFVWDSYTRYARCPCGISTDDFHTRAHNGFWNPDVKEKFDRAAQDSGRSWRREMREEEQGPPRLPTWQPPAVKLAWVEVYCPNCGRYIRDAYPPAREKCFACGAAVSVDKEGRVFCELPERAVYCRKCGRPITAAPATGAAYRCGRCGTWSALPGDRAGEKAAAKANEEQEKRSRNSQLPAPVLAKTRALAAGECANYLTGGPHHCLRGAGGEHSCVFFGSAPHRCAWFERGVLPLDPVTEETYWQEYGQVTGGAAEGEQAERAGKAAREGRKALKDARERREKICAFCGSPFLPRNNFERYCSLDHKKLARRQQDKERRKRADDAG